MVKICKGGNETPGSTKWGRGLFLTEDLLASQEILCSMELVRSL
jgi:hypothetical protein